MSSRQEGQSRPDHGRPDANRLAESGLDPKLVAIARQIEGQPWNREGSDKTWVLEALRQHQLFQAEVRAARRAESG